MGRILHAFCWFKVVLKLSLVCWVAVGWHLDFPANGLAH